MTTNETTDTQAATVLERKTKKETKGIEKKVNLERLTQKELIKKCPPIATKSPMEGHSQKYHFVNSLELVKFFEESGWFPREAQAAVVPKRSTHEGYQTHIVRFMPDIKKFGFTNKSGALEGFPEIVMTNSHNRLRALQFDMGVFRQVCANGLVAGESLMPTLKVKHHVQYQEMVAQIIKEALGSMSLITDTIHTLQSMELDSKMKKRFAKKVISMRWDNDKYVVSPSELFQPLRDEDQGDDLWTLMNVAQEKVINGGFTLNVRDKEGKLKSRQARPITGPWPGREYNKKLWDIGQQFINN